MNLELKHPLAFVPTMGALHAGHQSLITIAKNQAPNVLVSVFVNPLQFENPDDLNNYTRDRIGDTILIEDGGAQPWFPSFEEIYPDAPELVSSGKLGNQFEGVHRFGHFDGVLTVVKRLFQLTQPNFAVFGEKDFQQLFLIKQMVKQLDLPIKIISAPIVRHPDGLAMSSRNNRLSPDGRKAATVISRGLREAAICHTLSAARKKLHKILSSEPRFALDYAEIIDESNFNINTNSLIPSRAVVAGWIDDVRLIDNMRMFPVD